jgi:REP element-mobilizing transposase RayT
MKTNKFQNKYRIPSARAKWHDYNGGEYFITICTGGREYYFGEVRDNEMILSVIGKYTVDNLERINQHYPYCVVPLFVVMPNHIHAIVVIDEKPYVNNIPNAPNVFNVETMCTSSLQQKQTTPPTTLDVTDVTDVKTMCTSSLQKKLVDEKMQSVSVRRGKLSTAMGGFKRAITRFSNENKINFAWQTRFHDHIIRSQDEMNRIACYVENNVTTWENDKFYTK